MEGRVRIGGRPLSLSRPSSGAQCHRRHGSRIQGEHTTVIHCYQGRLAISIVARSRVNAAPPAGHRRDTILAQSLLDRDDVQD